MTDKEQPITVTGQGPGLQWVRPGLAHSMGPASQSSRGASPWASSAPRPRPPAPSSPCPLSPQPCFPPERRPAGARTAQHGVFSDAAIRIPGSLGLFVTRLELISFQQRLRSPVWTDGDFSVRPPACSRVSAVNGGGCLLQAPACRCLCEERSGTFSSMSKKTKRRGTVHDT